MTESFWSKTASLLLVHVLVLASSSARAQDATRPRRVQTTDTAVNVLPATRTTPAPFARLANEPLIRIGLATNARSVTISTTASSLDIFDATATDDAAAPTTALTVARVRVEPRMLAPLTSSPVLSEQLFRVQVASASTKTEAEEAARQVRELTGEETEAALDEQANTWHVRVGVPSSYAEAVELRMRLEDAGIVATVVAVESAKTNASNAHPLAANTSLKKANNSLTAGEGGASRASNLRAPQASSNSLRLASRMNAPTRGLVVYGAATAASATLLMDSHAPLVFGSSDDGSAPVRFNEKPYRGRLEVFTNVNGALTVVNVIKLEDYVRGVVPNELSPGSYPALEALKAQAVAARTYAISHQGQFVAEGFDLLPTTRSQVYGGLSTEHPLSTRAVEETRGIIATYQGQPINALYTSTCGGRTEDAESIFGGERVPYLRGHDADSEVERFAHASFLLKTTREPFALRELEHETSARDAALLSVYGFNLPARITDDWLSANTTNDEVRTWLEAVARLAHRSAPLVANDATRPPAFSSALALALDGESRADVLLAEADVVYLLTFRDADEIPARNRADVAMLLRDGHLKLYPDATLRPHLAMARARVLHTIAHLLEARGLFNFQKATARPAAGMSLIVRSGSSSGMRGAEHVLEVSPNVYLFRAFGESLYQMREVNLVGGEPLNFHTDARGAVDYMEVRPAPNGATAEHSSPFTNWTTSLTPSEIVNRLSHYTNHLGSLVDLHVAQRGSSRRVLDLEIIGTGGTAHLRGGRIRSALGLREQLFVIDRRYDENGRVSHFIFTGRGWGHGVGMCQVGAYGLARAGWTYDKILKNYYTGIELTKLY